MPGLPQETIGNNDRAPWIHQLEHLCVTLAWAADLKPKLPLERAGELKGAHESQGQ